MKTFLILLAILSLLSIAGISTDLAVNPYLNIKSKILLLAIMVTLFLMSLLGLFMFCN